MFNVHCPTRRQVPPVLKSIFIFQTLTPNVPTLFSLSCTLWSIPIAIFLSSCGCAWHLDFIPISLPFTAPIRFLIPAQQLKKLPQLLYVRIYFFLEQERRALFIWCWYTSIRLVQYIYFYIQGCQSELKSGGAEWDFSRLWDLEARNLGYIRDFETKKVVVHMHLLHQLVWRPCLYY